MPLQSQILNKNNITKLFFAPHMVAIKFLYISDDNT